MEFTDLDLLKLTLLELSTKYGYNSLIKTYNELGSIENIISFILHELTSFSYKDCVIYLDSKIIRLFKVEQSFILSEVDSITEISQKEIKTIDETQVSIMSKEDRNLLLNHISNQLFDYYTLKNLPLEYILKLKESLTHLKTIKETLLSLLKEYPISIHYLDHFVDFNNLTFTLCLDKLSILLNDTLNLSKNSNLKIDQEFKPKNYFLPEFNDSRLSLSYCDLVDHLIYTYNKLFDHLSKDFSKEKAFSILQYILPVSLYTKNIVTVSKELFAKQNNYLEYSELCLILNKELNIQFKPLTRDLIKEKLFYESNNNNNKSISFLDEVKSNNEFLSKDIDKFFYLLTGKSNSSHSQMYKKLSINEYIDSFLVSKNSELFDYIYLDFTITSIYAFFNFLSSFKHLNLTAPIFLNIKDTPIELDLLTPEIKSVLSQCYYYSDNFLTLLTDFDNSITDYCRLFSDKVSFNMHLNLNTFIFLMKELKNSKDSLHLKFFELFEKEFKNKWSILFDILKVV